jgi:hypothetical protein
MSIIEFANNPIVMIRNARILTSKDSYCGSMNNPLMQ